MAELKETLWQLSDRYQAIADRILEAGDLTPEMEAEFDEVSEALAVKMQHCSEFMHTLEVNAEFSAAEASRLAGRAKTWDRGAKGMKRYMLAQLLRADIRSLRSTDGTRLWTVRKSPGRVVIDDLSAIPDNLLVRSEPKPDLVAIRKLLGQGVPVAAHIETDDTLQES